MLLCQSAKLPHVFMSLNQQTVVGRYAFNNHGSQFIAVLGKESFERFIIIKWQDGCFGRDRLRYAC